MNDTNYISANALEVFLEEKKYVPRIHLFSLTATVNLSAACGDRINAINQSIPPKVSASIWYVHGLSQGSIFGLERLSHGMPLLHYGAGEVWCIYEVTTHKYTLTKLVLAPG
jgi:predicted membrane-bound dolichyl-phosphate-mannose-protein mannosyltransferase